MRRFAFTMSETSEMLRASGIPEPMPEAATATGCLSGAAAGALAGAIAGPVGAICGAVIGAVAGAAVGVGLGENEVLKDRAERELDDEMGVTAGSIGAPQTTIPSRVGAPSSVGGSVHEGFDDTSFDPLSR